MRAAALPLTLRGYYLLSFQFFIQGSCQLQHHGAGHSRVRGTLELPAVPLRLVVLGVVVTGQDETALGWWVERRNDVRERQRAIGCSWREPILSHFPACSEGTEGCFDVLWRQAHKIPVSNEQVHKRVPHHHNVVCVLRFIMTEITVFSAFKRRNDSLPAQPGCLQSLDTW